MKRPSTKPPASSAPAATAASLALLLAACAPHRPAFVQHGEASYHAPFFLSSKARTASGERWLNSKNVAAHRSLPFGTQVKVTNLENGRTTKVRIIDRGPYIGGRIIDVSKRAAKKLRFHHQGTAPVRIEASP